MNPSANYAPQDATTNSTLIYKAVQIEEYKPLLEKAIADNASSVLSTSARVKTIIDDLLVLFGRKILEIVPGRVSTEVDARLSFDAEATVQKPATSLDFTKKRAFLGCASLLRSPRHGRGLVPLRFAKRRHPLQPDSHVFAGAAIACAEAGVTLISPFRRPEYDAFRKAASHQEPNDVVRQIDDWGKVQLTFTFDICDDMDTDVPKAIRYKTIRVHCLS